MARTVQFGDGSTSASQDKSGSPSQEKALSDVQITGGDTDGGGGGFVLDLFSSDTDRDLTQEQVLRAYHRSPPLHLAVSAIARTVGEVSLEWDGDTPGDFNLQRPNRWHQSAEFMSLLAAYLKLPGEVVIIKKQAANGAELIPIPPHLVEEPESWSGEYKIENAGVNLSKTTFDRDELIILQEPSLLDPFMEGEGPGQVVGADVDIDEAAATHTASYLENHARPDALVSLEGATPRDIDRFREAMRKKHGGPGGTGKIEAFESSVSVETLQSSFDDLGLSVVRERSAELIRHVFGIPPSIIGDVSDTNRATAETEEYLFRQNLIKPLVDKIVSGLNQQFVKQDLGSEFELTTGKIVPEDRRFKAELYRKLPQAFTVDEARELAGEEPLEGSEGEQTLAEAMPTPAGGASSAMRDQADREKGTKKNIVSLRTKQREEEIERVLEAVGAEDMNGLRDRFDEAFRDEATQTVDDLDGESLEDVFGGGDLNQVAIAETQSRMEWVLPQIADSTKGELRETIHEGLDEGIQSRELARRVDDKFGEFSRVRANNIARTEMLSASSAGTHAAHRNSNVVKFRSWLSNRDNDVRPEHATLDQITSQDPIPVDQPFQVAGASAMHPGDFGVARLDCQCRCDTVAEFPDQRQRTEAERTKIWKRYAKRLDERERATRAVVRAAFEQQRERVLERFADEFNVDLEAVA